MLSSDKLIKLYTRYGFEQGPSSDQCLVFFSQKGYFQNAEIVLLNDDVKPEEIDKSEYEQMGSVLSKISQRCMMRFLVDSLIRKSPTIGYYGNILAFVNSNKINFLEVNMNMWQVILLKMD